MKLHRRTVQVERNPEPSVCRRNLQTDWFMGKGVNMILLAKVLMLAVITAGAVIIFSAAAIKALFAFAKEENGIKFIGSARITVGAILLAASSGSRHIGLVVFFGLLLVLCGTAALLIKKDVITHMIGFWEKQPAHILRLIGFIPILFGIIMLFAL